MDVSQTNEESLVEDALDIIPRGLKFCFHREVFLDDYFDPVDFLKQQHLLGFAMEDLYNSLLQYSNVLKNGLVELINRDYSVFVRLSQNLNGLDKTIIKIGEPFNNYSVKLQTTRKVLETLIEKLQGLKTSQEKILTERRFIRDIQEMNSCIETLERWLESCDAHKTSGKSLKRNGVKSSQFFDELIKQYESDIYKEANISHDDEDQIWPEYLWIEHLDNHGDPTDRFDWIANVYIKLNYLTKKCHSEHPIVIKLHSRINRIKTELLEHFQDQLTEVISNIFTENFNSKSTYANEFRQILNIYRSLDLIEFAQIQIQEILFKPRLSKIIVASKELTASSVAPEVCASTFRKMNEDCLEILDEIGSGLQSLFVSNNSSTLQELGIDIVVDSFWPQYVIHILSIPEIFHYVQADRFQKMYQVAMDFISKLTSRLKDANQIYSFKNHKAFIDFSAKWNLAIYFRMRYQETSDKFDSLAANILNPVQQLDERFGFKLEFPQFIIHELFKIWQGNDIYLERLRHRFFKLSLQMLKSFSQLISQELSRSCIDDLFSSRQNNTATRTMESTFCLINDLVLFEDIIHCELLLAINERLFNPANSDSIKDVSGLNLQIGSVFKKISQNINSIIQQLIDQDNIIKLKNSQILRQMLDVPRQFRRTNREVPTNHSQYVTSLWDSYVRIQNNSRIISIERSSAKILIENLLLKCLQGCIGQFSVQLTEVITGISKSADSLRKLREARLGGASTDRSNQTKNADEDKMRQQLFLDASEFVKKIRLGANFPLNQIESSLKELIMITVNCSNCSKQAIFSCCPNASYCTVICQQEHWTKEHNKNCQKEQN